MPAKASLAGLRPGFNQVARVDYRWDGARLADERRFMADGTLIREVQ